MKHQSMGQKSMMPDGWIPSGMVSRQIATLLTKERPDGGVFEALQERTKGLTQPPPWRPPSTTSSQRAVALGQSRSQSMPRLLPPLENSPAEKTNWAEVAGIR